MNSWSDLGEFIKNKQLKNSPWLSDQRHLIQIIDASEKLGIDPTDASKASISNLRTIIKPARHAIINKDIKKLSGLFEAAAKLPTCQLRVYVGAHKIEKIAYKENVKKGCTYIQLELNPYQFTRILQISKAWYIFVKK
jgi:hypothetical protein